LITELAKAFVRAEDLVRDSVAFAIQELIRIFEIRSDAGTTGPSREPQPGEQVPGGKGHGGSSSSASSDNQLWKRFSADVREIITPFMHSLYLLQFEFNSALVVPIYRSKKGLTFELWVCTLASYLGSKINAVRCREVFNACRAVVKQDTQLALYLLPYLAVQV